MKTGTAFRGQPLLLLIVLVGGWVLIRLALWETPFEEASSQVVELVVASQKIPSAKMGDLIRSEVLDFRGDGTAQSGSRYETKRPNLSGVNIEQAHRNAVGLAIAPGEAADFSGKYSSLQPSEVSVIPIPYAATVPPQTQLTINKTRREIAADITRLRIGFCAQKPMPDQKQVAA